MIPARNKVAERAHAREAGAPEMTRPRPNRRRRAWARGKQARLTRFSAPWRLACASSRPTMADRHRWSVWGFWGGFPAPGRFGRCPSPGTRVRSRQNRVRNRLQGFTCPTVADRRRWPVWGFWGGSGRIGTFWTVPQLQDPRVNACHAGFPAFPHPKRPHRAGLRQVARVGLLVRFWPKPAGKRGQTRFPGVSTAQAAPPCRIAAGGPCRASGAALVLGGARA